MAAPDSQPQDLPQVLLLKPPPAFTLLGDQFFSSNKFKFLKAYESELPLAQFLKTHAGSVQAILSSGGAPVTAEILGQLPLGRLVVTTHAGLDHINLAECHRRGIAVTNAGIVFSEDAADRAVRLLIDVLRKTSAADGTILLVLKSKYLCSFMDLGQLVVGNSEAFFSNNPLLSAVGED